MNPKKKNRFFLLQVLLTGLLLAALLIGPWAFQRAKRWQAQQHYDQARLLEEAGDLTGAVQRAEASFRLMPSNDAVLMYLARMALILPEPHPQTTEWWNKAMRSPDCTTADILRYAEYLVRRGDRARAYPIVSNLRRIEPGNESIVRLQASLLSRERKFGEAENLLRGAIAEAGEAAEPETLMALVEILANKPDEASRREANNLLRTLLEETGEPRLFALRRIILRPSFPDQDRADAAKALLATADLDIADQLSAYNALLEVREISRRDIRENLTRILQEQRDKDPDAVARFASWLINSDQSRYVLSLLTPEDAQADSNLYVARGLAMIRNNQAGEVYDMTLDRTDQNPLSQVENLLLRAYALLALDRRQEYEDTLNSLVDASQFDTFRLVENELAEFGAWDQLLRHYQKLREFDRTRPLARRRLLYAYYYLGREREILAHLSEFDGYVAEEDPPTQGLIAYLNGLYGRQLDSALTTAENLVTRYPNVADFRIVLAFIYARQGETEKAAPLLEGIGEVGRGQPRHLQIAYAAVRRLLDQSQDGILEMRVGQDDLLPTERAILREL